MILKRELVSLVIVKAQDLNKHIAPYQTYEKHHWTNL